MRLANKIKEAGATGYILLWLLGIPIPICSSSSSCEVAHRNREKEEVLLFAIKARFQ